MPPCLFHKIHYKTLFRNSQEWFKACFYYFGIFYFPYDSFYHKIEVQGYFHLKLGILFL